MGRQGWKRATENGSGHSVGKPCVRWVRPPALASSRRLTNAVTGVRSWIGPARIEGRADPPGSDSPRSRQPLLLEGKLHEARTKGSSTVTGRKPHQRRSEGRVGWGGFEALL